MIRVNTRKFHIATEEEIKNAETSDVYFERTKEILEKEGLSDIHVTAEITTGSLPKDWEWGILAGIDADSSMIGAKLLGKSPTGTMPHSLIIAIGDQVRAWKSFDKYMPKEVPRIALVDTYYDEKTESIMAAQALGKSLYGVRLDTPSSRRGNFQEIIREVRWELDSRGFKDVKIFVSGGLDDESVRTLSEAGADGFGVGTSVSNAPVVDFALDIIEKEGKPVAKRGRHGGREEVWRCDKCLLDFVLLDG